MAVVLNPLVKWAQDRYLIYLTVEISDAVINCLEIDEKKMRFEGFGNGAKGENIYKLDLTFRENIDPKLCKHKVTDRCVMFSLKKTKSNYWERLLANNNKPGWLKIDFDRWRGEDDSDDELEEAEIRKISVEQRKKQMETQLEDHVRKAEEEVKELVIKGYLTIYNVIQGVAFLYITFSILIKLLFNGSGAVPEVYNGVSDLLGTCQIAAFIEPINAAFKLVHTGVFAPLMQSIGHFIALFMVITPHQELQKSVFVVIVFLAWSLTENVRYPFYFLQTIGYCPKWLLWLRYTAWVPLYPLGIVTEGILVYQAANLFDATNRWSLPLKFIADITIPFSLLLRLYLVILVIGGGYLLKHMWSLRVKKYGRTSTRRIRKTVKKE